MRFSGVADGESGSQISSEMLNFLDILEQLAVDGLLDVLEL